MTFLFFFASQSFQLFCIAQQPLEKTKVISLIFAKKHIGFSITPLLIEKAILTKNIDLYSIHATSLIGAEAGLTNYIHIDNKHSVGIGLFLNAFPRNLNYSIPTNELVPPDTENLTINGLASREFYFSGSIPIAVEKRWFIKNNNFISINAGLTARYTPTLYDSYEDYWYASYRYFSMEFISNPKNKFWLNYNFGAGYSSILKNMNILKANLVGNLSFTRFAKGHYQFTLPNKPVVEGRYETKGSYLGISINYILTGTKKRLKTLKQLENQSARKNSLFNP